ncbi:MAG: ferrous iron transport protein B [Holophagales bacterium]|jgi:ferrous iron transport protein B|nr:ferrous iron transport protein B [Holophagales bacterium]
MTLVALAGNPNCGKTTIFNALTGLRHHVGNYPGVTVELQSGQLVLGDSVIEILDLPGTYSLSAHSEDERIAAKELIKKNVDVIINILDASNLERNLYLTAQLIELRRPIIFVINMIDDAEKTGKVIDIEKLELLLGGPVIPTVGSRQDGIQKLRSKIQEILNQDEICHRQIPISYGDDIENELRKLELEISQDEQLAEGVAPRWLALGLLENHQWALTLASESHASRAIENQRRESAAFLEGHLGEDATALLAERRYGFAHGLFAETVQTTAESGRNLTEKLDAVLTHRWLGIPIFIAILMAMYAVTFVLGKLPEAWISRLFENLQNWVSIQLPHGELASLLANGIIPGVGAVAAFLPVILVLMGCVSFLEDTGYMARAAFIMDRLMHLMGLHGKSFIPLVMGTGCNVPAIQATRIIEAKDDRLITILVVPLISCSARLQVYILLASAFFQPVYAAFVVIGLHILSFGVAVLMGKILRWTLFHGETTPFVMELPPYRMPVLKSTIIHMWEKGSTFLTHAGTSILAGAALIWFFSHYPGIASYELKSKYAQTQLEIKAKELPADEERCALEQMEAEHQTQILNTSFAASFGRKIQPILQPILDPDKSRQDAWKDSVALTVGFVAKELVVSTTAVMYRIPSSDGDADDLSLQDTLRFSSGMMPLTAISFLVFVLLYTPCLATLSMIYEETKSLLWPAFTICYGLFLAWGMSWMVIHVGRMVIGS